MKLSTLQLIRQKPGLILAVYAAPFFATEVGFVYASKYWFYFLVSLVGTFIVTLDLVHSLLTSTISGRFGSLQKAEHPVRFWMQIWVWIAMLVCATGFPLAVSFIRL